VNPNTLCMQDENCIVWYAKCIVKVYIC